jgi:hypothetical protein
MESVTGALFGRTGPQNSAINVQGIVCVFIIFQYRHSSKNCCGNESLRRQFMNSGGRLFTFRSLVRQWKPVIENEFYVMIGLYLLMGIIQNPTLWAYFFKKENNANSRIW